MERFMLAVNQFLGKTSRGFQFSPESSCRKLDAIGDNLVESFAKQIARDNAVG